MASNVTADIPEPESVKVLERRSDGQARGRDAVPKKAAAIYAEAARTNPDDDRITILGIPFDQITPATQAALAGLVAEINYLRNVVKRLERGQRRPAEAGEPPTAILETRALLRAIDGVLAQTPAPGTSWVMVLVYVATYEDIRRSSGLLAANAALADVAQRLREMDFDGARFDVLGFGGGSTLAGVIALPASGLECEGLAAGVCEKLLAAGYTVSGIDMMLAMSAAAAPVGAGESALLAIARTDHILLRPRQHRPH